MKHAVLVASLHLALIPSQPPPHFVLDRRPTDPSIHPHPTSTRKRGAEVERGRADGHASERKPPLAFPPHASSPPSSLESSLPFPRPITLTLLTSGLVTYHHIRVKGIYPANTPYLSSREAMSERREAQIPFRPLFCCRSVLSQ
ncbi:hypothetical protein FA13DRAFT_892443 [Coprinellus micaceus]|uniref:Uncharacterized protein n=1 Tax=Coprinellus micaceus TaxID=71717 RepID=A0A4Y7TUJ4_COPMI|nr:hypothetical protein FA13DRAFT_892443 [Coprinellus micaceus]